MKKLAATFLIALYALATMGTTIAMHYCMGDKMGVSIGYSDPEVCDYCHMQTHPSEDPNHCCKNENHFVKVTADQNISASFQWINTSISSVALIIPKFFNRSLNPIFIRGGIENLYPPEIPIYQRFCNFRI